MTQVGTVMAEVCEALAEQHAELWGLVEGLDEAGWHRPSRCEGWDVADVVLHMAQTDEMAVASLDGRLDGDLDGGLPAGYDALGPSATVDDVAAWAVEHERGASGADVAERWRTTAEALRAHLAGDDPSRRVRWVVGEMAAVTLATTRLAESWIHTGDVAEALGREQVPGERLRYIARLAWRTLPYAFGRAGRELSGPVAFRLTGPAGRPWVFEPDTDPVTVVEGPGADLCLVAARRLTPSQTSLTATGPDADAVLELVRTYA